MPTPPPDTSLPNDLEIVLPLRVEFAPTLRTVVASVGSDLGFSLDELDDLRLALSEVFSVFAQDALPAARARVACSWTPGSLVVGVSCRERERPVQLDELATRILQSVTDEVVIEPTQITFSKRTFEMTEAR